MKPVPRSIVLSLVALAGVASISAQVAERPATRRPSAQMRDMHGKGKAPSCRGRRGPPGVPNGSPQVGVPPRGSQDP